MELVYVIQIAGLALTVVGFLGLGDVLERDLGKFRRELLRELPESLKRSTGFWPAFRTEMSRKVKEELEDLSDPKQIFTDDFRGRYIKYGVPAILLLFVITFWWKDGSLFWAIVFVSLFAIVGFVVIWVQWTVIWFAIEYVVCYVLWRVLHLLNKAPSGVVGSLGLIFAIAPFIIEYLANQ